MRFLAGSLSVWIALTAIPLRSQEMLNLVAVEGEGAINNISQRTAREVSAKTIAIIAVVAGAAAAGGAVAATRGGGGGNGNSSLGVPTTISALTGTVGHP
jgi:hypothetical protein